MDDVLNYDDMYSSHSEQSGSDSEDGGREEENGSEPEDGLIQSDDNSYPRDNSDLSVQLSCPKHKPGQMSMQCKSCSKALAMIKPEMRATLSTVGSNFYIAQISQFSKIFQLRVFATIFQSFAISSVFELDTSSFGFWAFFHVSLGVFFQNWSTFQNLPVPVSQSGG